MTTSLRFYESTARRSRNNRATVHNPRLKLTRAAILVSWGLMSLSAAAAAEPCHSAAERGGIVGGRLWRDASGRLTCDSPGVAVADYPALCRAVADAFGLAPVNELVVGPDQMFWEFDRGGQVVGLDWDIWFEFMAVAHSPASEPLVHEIAGWLRSRQDAEPGAAADPASSVVSTVRLPVPGLLSLVVRSQR